MTIDPNAFDKDPLKIMRDMAVHLAYASDEVAVSLFMNGQLDEVPVYGLTMDKEDEDELMRIMMKLDELHKKYSEKTDKMRDECKEA